MLYPPLKTTRKTGAETFTYENRDLGITLLDFWKWSVSDLVSNATRGRLAEFIVASALDVKCDVREEWAAYDLKTADGTKVEVKSAAYMQSWAQNAQSTIQFGCVMTYFDCNLDTPTTAPLKWRAPIRNSEPDVCPTFPHEIFVMHRVSFY